MSSPLAPTHLDWPDVAAFPESDLQDAATFDCDPNVWSPAPALDVVLWGWSAECASFCDY